MAGLRFGDFELDLDGGELRKGNAPVRLQPQPLKVLMLLAARSGQIVSREQIQKEVWADDTFVDFDQGLNYCIRRIRAALGDDTVAPRFIETVSKRGYRFLPAVETAAPRADRRAMIVVLPFQNLTGDSEQEYLSDGVTEEVIAQLGRLNPARLGVIARTSAMRYKQSGKTIDAIGRELAVSYALEGSVRGGGGRIRMTAQLIRVADQTHLWADSFERPSEDLLALQAEVAQAVAAQIGVQLTPQEEAKLETRRAVDVRAHDLYLKGRYSWKRRSREALRKSVEYFSEAIRVDPDYAAAYAGLADVYLTQMDYNYLPPREGFALADRALLDALRLDNTVAEPHTSLGHLRFHQFNWTSAEQQFKHAISLNPGYDSAHYYYANLLAALGRFDEAIDQAEQALALDPLSPNTRQNLLFVLYLARRYDEFMAQIDEVIAMDASYTPIHYYLGLLLERQGDYDGALKAFENVSRKSHSRGTTVLAAIGFTHARAGHRDAATAILRRLEAPAEGEYVSSHDLALIHFALGGRDAGFEILRKACDEYSSFVPFLRIDARLDEVRADPRFQALLERLKFPGATASSSERHSGPPPPSQAP